MTVDLGPHGGITLNLREDIEGVREALIRRLTSSKYTWAEIAKRQEAKGSHPMSVDEEIRASAFLNVAVIVENQWENNGPEAVARLALNRILRYSQYPHRSTSPTSRLFEEEKTAAWCEVLDYLCGLP